MLSLPPAVRIWLCLRPADMRKSFDGLAAMTRQILLQDPIASGHLFVFVSRRADRLKVLWWDRDGYALYLVADGKDHVEIVVFNRALDLARAFLANY